MQPRPYQSEAMDALDAYLSERPGNPCVVLPTGAGKTPCMAWTVQRWRASHPIRALVVAHVPELIVQFEAKLKAVCPDAPVGVLSAKLKRNDRRADILAATIGSVANKILDLDPFDVIMVDEAHRIPLRSEGQYHQLVEHAKLNNPRLRVVAWTATPYRLAGGLICGPKYVINDVCYSANVKHLIDDGFLCKLRTKVGKREVNTAGIRKSGGDFNQGQLEAAALEGVAGIVGEAVDILERENRRSVLFFCCTKEHADKVSKALALYGWACPVIHDGTPDAERTGYAREFVAGNLRALANINILSEGFDAPTVDAVVLIRPTESQGLYYQQVGRGLRTHPSKADCLVLDFAGNVSRHGPLDMLEGNRPAMQTCRACQEHYPKPMGKCPACGWVPPPSSVAGDAPPKSERIIPSDPKARTEAAILSDGEPWDMDVADVTATRHAKPDKPPMIKVTYHGPGGLESHTEWVCLSHPPGYALHKAREWWRARFGKTIPASTDDALSQDLFLGARVAEKTQSIRVRQNGRFTEVIGVKFKRNEAAAVVG
ncbi:MAG: type restriction enzyme EcoKI subunit [Phycisphaerales bacterium]|nr:type restriction enzyme EcoKI subunit [Phycisphaerales bacterium]